MQETNRRSPEVFPGEVIPATYDFGIAEIGYEPVEPVGFTIRNTGSRPLRQLRVSMEDRDMEKFWLCLTYTADALGCAGGQDSATPFYAYPVDGLASGAYTARVRITAEGVPPLAMTLRFAVGPAQVPGREELTP